MKTLAEYLDLAAVAHGHLCAGQVLGVRLAMLGLRELGIDDPIAERKRSVIGGSFSIERILYRRSRIRDSRSVRTVFRNIFLRSRSGREGGLPRRLHV